MEKLDQAVAKQVRQAREKRRFHQDDLARAVDISRTSVSNIERGKQGLSLDLFCKIALALDYEPWDLLREVLTRKDTVDLASEVKNMVKDLKIRKLMVGAVNKEGEDNE